jgi:hypothetical protein
VYEYPSICGTVKWSSEDETRIKREFHLTKRHESIIRKINFLRSVE